MKKVSYCYLLVSNRAGQGTKVLETLHDAGVDEFERIVCVGDGVWDVHTATSLGLTCIGIGTGGRAERLGTAGASRVFPDFTNLEAVLNALEEATPDMPG